MMGGPVPVALLSVATRGLVIHYLFTVPNPYRRIPKIPVWTTGTCTGRWSFLAKELAPCFQHVLSGAGLHPASVIRRLSSDPTPWIRFVSRIMVDFGIFTVKNTSNIMPRQSHSLVTAEIRCWLG